MTMLPDKRFTQELSLMPIRDRTIVGRSALESGCVRT